MKTISASAAAAELLQSCPTLCDPIDSSPPGSPVPEILQARTLEWVAISFSNAWKWKVKVKSLSRVRLLATPWTAAHQAPPSMGFSRREYWSGVPLPSPVTCLVAIYCIQQRTQICAPGQSLRNSKHGASSCPHPGEAGQCWHLPVTASRDTAHWRSPPSPGLQFLSGCITQTQLTRHDWAQSPVHLEVKLTWYEPNPLP